MDMFNNPHDRFFKEVMSEREIIRDFLQNYLPAEMVRLIDLESITAEKDSFVEKELQEYFSDLLFRVRLENEEA